ARRDPDDLAAADGITWTHLAGDLRAALTSTGFHVLLGPRDVDLLVVLGLGPREYDAALAEHVAHLFHGALDRHGLGPRDAALAIGAPADTWTAAGPALRRVRRSAGAATALPVARWPGVRRCAARATVPRPCVLRAPRHGRAALLPDLRDEPALDAFVAEQLGPLLG